MYLCFNTLLNVTFNCYLIFVRVVLIFSLIVCKGVFFTCKCTCKQGVVCPMLSWYWIIFLNFSGSVQSKAPVAIGIFVGFLVWKNNSCDCLFHRELGSSLQEYSALMINICWNWRDSPLITAKEQDVRTLGLNRIINFVHIADCPVSFGFRWKYNCCC